MSNVTLPTKRAVTKKSSRRQFLAAASLTIGGIAGCSSTGSETVVTDGSDPTATRTPAATETRGSTPTETAEPTSTDEPTPSETPESTEGGHNHQTETSEFSDRTLAKAQELGTTVQQSVVKLTDGNSGGTGWVIDDGYIVTNSHVVRDSETMDVETFDGETGTAMREGYHGDMIPDVALMSTDLSTPTPLSMESDVALSKGDPVVTVGHPSEVGDWVISLGHYSQYESGINWELSDIPTDQGNSGSPILTLDGTVFGCVSGTTTMSGRSEGVDRSEEVYTEFPEEETLATAVPSKTVRKWVDEWK